MEHTGEQGYCLVPDSAYIEFFMSPFEPAMKMVNISGPKSVSCHAETEQGCCVKCIDAGNGDFILLPVGSGRSVITFHSDEADISPCSVTVNVVTPTQDQLNVFQEAAGAGSDILVIGPGGTGKSVLIRNIAQTFIRQGLETLVLAPTGRAAENINGHTIESVIHNNKPVRIDVNGKPYFETAAFKNNNISKVIVDEIFAVRADIFDSLMASIEAAERVCGHRIQVILFGDWGQLPPVISDENGGLDRLESAYGRNMGNGEFYRGNYWSNYGGEGITAHDRQGWFVAGAQNNEWVREGLRDDSNHAIRKPLGLAHRFRVLTMKEIVRSSDAEYQKALSVIRTPSAYNQNDIHEALEYFRNSTSHTKIGDAPWMSGVSALVESHIPNPPEGAAITEAYNMKLWAGMRVMSSMNDHGYKAPPKYRNGSLGVITRINEGKNFSVTVKFDNGNTCRIEPVKVVTPRIGMTYDGELERIGSSEIGRKVILPLISGDSFTFHKAQGMTMDKVNIELTGQYTDDGKERFWQCTGQKGMLYVALSRCRHPGDMYIKGLDELTEQNVINGAAEAGYLFFCVSQEPEERKQQKPKSGTGRIPRAIADRFRFLKEKEDVVDFNLTGRAIAKALIDTDAYRNWLDKNYPLDENQKAESRRGNTDRQGNSDSKRKPKKGEWPVDAEPAHHKKLMLPEFGPEDAEFCVDDLMSHCLKKLSPEEAENTVNIVVRAINVSVFFKKQTRAFLGDEFYNHQALKESLFRSPPLPDETSSDTWFSLWKGNRLVRKESPIVWPSKPILEEFEEMLKAGTADAVSDQNANPQP